MDLVVASSPRLRISARFQIFAKNKLMKNPWILKSVVKKQDLDIDFSRETRSQAVLEASSGALSGSDAPTPLRAEPVGSG